MQSDVHRLRSMHGHDLADQNKAGLPQICIGCACYCTSGVVECV